MFLADTWPVTMRQSICTVSEDISQVFATPTTSASSGPERCVSTRPGGQTCGPSSSVMPSRPIGLPCSITRGTGATIRNRSPARSTSIEMSRPGAPLTTATNSRAVGDGLTVHRQQPIARRAIPRARRRCPAGADVHQRVGIPGRQIEAQARQQFAGLGQGAPIRRSTRSVSERSPPSRRTRSGITPSSVNWRIRAICSSSVSSTLRSPTRTI